MVLPLLIAGVTGVGHAADPVAGGNPCSPAAPNGLLGVNSNRTGLVDLYFFNAGGATVTYFECLGSRTERLGEAASSSAATTTSLSTPWLCDRLARSFAATITLADGTVVRGVNSIRTMSCADRFAVIVPREVSWGQDARIRLIDRWGTGGIHTRLCIRPPGGRSACSVVGFPAAVTSATRTFRAAARGDWGVMLEVRGYRVRATIAVGVKSVAMTAVPTVLATGDSTMQGVESFLADDLGAAATVVSEVHPGYGVSTVDWPGIAASQVARLKPATTVISLGADEGFPMKTSAGASVVCCGEAWIAEYARRVRESMSIYRQRGRSRVFYLTIATARNPGVVPIDAAVNAGIIRAAQGLAGVRVLRMDLLFSPHGYRETIRYRGRDVDVREPDGVHLNVAGTAIEARVTAQALRRSPG